MRASDDQTLRQAGRLALRHEGKMWNAYFALPNTMDGAVFLGSIAMAAVVDNVNRKQDFMRLMQSFVADLLTDKTGVRPTWWEPRDAPESEKAGHS